MTFWDIAKKNTDIMPTITYKYFKTKDKIK